MLSGIPLSGIPLSGIPLSGIPLSGIPFDGIQGEFEAIASPEFRKLQVEIIILICYFSYFSHSA